MWPALQAFRLRDAIDILLVALVLFGLGGRTWFNSLRRYSGSAA